ncbi:twin-arginine translocation signal domain-containing protein [Halomicrobium salinisoli]|uniref:twin-arginine translocation signal domain-containing protein n=1 Tax=Halomicrobium salinisoli TaxID=2878391 RepID=UPI001CEFF41A|nr:twin-arginine translocation signal domain-containing protein [Halomicrobium salinisoli]
MTDDSSTDDVADASTLTTDRRRFLQAATAAGTGLTGFGGLASGQGSSDTHIGLEAVTVDVGGDRGRSEYAWEDGEGGVVRGGPPAVRRHRGGRQRTVTEASNWPLRLGGGPRTR